MADNGVHVDQFTKQKNKIIAQPDPKKRREAEILHAEKETQEVIDAGQDNLKKAIESIDSQEKDRIKEEKRVEDDILNRLDSRRRFESSYMRELANALAQLLTQLDWVRGWTADCVVTNGSPITIKGRGFQTQKGILLVVCAPDGRVMHQGMKVTGEPMLDYAGLVSMALQAENTMDYERGLLLDTHKSEGLVNKDGRSLKTDTRRT